MAQSPTDQDWNLWSQDRKVELCAEGMPESLALMQASNEAHCRAETAKLVGLEAALNCDLVMQLRPDGTFSTYAMVPIEAVPAKLLPVARAWAGNVTSKVQ